MEKCDVCGKSTLLPERFGSTNVCKVCFLKMYGPIWKYRNYDKYIEVEKQREKTIAHIKKMNVSKDVEEGITAFFDRQNIGMKSCDCCETVVQQLNKIGKNSLCRECYSKINIKEWNENNYLNNDDVEKNRNKIIKIASQYNFPSKIIDDINEYFDKKIEVGLFRVVIGYDAQKLKVYDSYCIIVTEDNFDRDSAYVFYGEALKRNQNKIKKNATETAINVVKTFATSGFVRGGIALATDAAMKANANSKEVRQRFKVYRGTHRIEYSDISKIEFQDVSENALGFIRISMINNVSSDGDVVFLFHDGDAMNAVYEYMTERVELIHKEKDDIKNQISNSTIPDEILKYKNLLDLGAITQEEFDEKKKELLGLKK